MKRIPLTAVTLGLVTLAAAACGAPTGGTACVRANTILQSCGLPESEKLGACTGATLTYADCVVMHETAVCSGLSNAKDLTNAFNKCSSSVTKP